MPRSPPPYDGPPPPRGLRVRWSGDVQKHDESGAKNSLHA